MGDAKATDAAFAKAARAVTLELVNNRVVANSMEPRNAIADYDPASGRSTLYTGDARPAFRARSARRNRAQDAEGQAAPDHAQCRRRLRHEGVRLSRAGAGGLGQPQDRAAGEVAGGSLAKDSSPTIRAATTPPAPSWRSIRAAASSACAFRSSPMSALICRRSAAFVPTRSTDLVSGLYAIGAIHINVKGVCTNTVPVCAYRGAGRPEAGYLLERLVDAAARELGHDAGCHPPHQFRAAVGDALHVGDQATARFRRVRDR